MKPLPEKDLQKIVGNVLRYGVWLAMTVVLIGFTLYLIQFGNNPVDYSNFKIKNGFDIHLFWKALLKGNSIALIQAGVLLLIATPIIRLLCSLIGFWLEKNMKYTIISLIVLCIIAYSLLFGVGTH